MTGPAARFVLCAALALATAACSDAGDVAEGVDPEIEQGRAALETRCARCHAIGESDTSAHAEAPPFREIVRRYPPENLAESLAEGIMTGHPDMPQFVLAPDEIGAVIDYLTTLMPNR